MSKTFLQILGPRKSKKRKRRPRKIPCPSYNMIAKSSKDLPLNFKSTITNCGYHNLSSSRRLTPLESFVLSCGLQFIPTPRAVSDEDILHDFHTFCRRVRLKKWALCNDLNSCYNKTDLPYKNKKPSPFVPPLASPQIETYLRDVFNRLSMALSYNIGSKPNRRMINYPRNFMSTLKQLHDDATINIVPSDKNLGLCIVDRSWYLSAIFKHLHNAETYERVLTNPSTSDIYLKL